LEDNKFKIAVIGLGYVGLPLAILFSSKYSVIGLDTNSSRVSKVNQFLDETNEVNSQALKKALNTNLLVTNKYKDIKDCNIYIVTVPTPIDKMKNPDLSYLLDATKDIGELISKGDIIIYESTVYPGCTEEICVPVLEKISGLKYNQDFYCGYSPERINPGDRKNTIDKIIKVTSGSNEYSSKKVDELYSSVISAGTYNVSSIKVAEASKAIENAQRDLNISFVNELALMFDKMKIDTTEVLDAASTKWNFLKFRPGLVGGHCISVDPYYLTFKSESMGYSPNVILSGRMVNEQMGDFVAQKLINLMNDKMMPIKGSNILILGITYKEDCPDIRNTKIPEVYKFLNKHGANVSVHDPYADPKIVYDKYDIKLVNTLNKYDGIILAVAHSSFKDLDYINLKSQQNAVIFDVKSFLDKNIVDARL
jgi:UDP-N-acetyl-D-glucosamine/UDP-N-acetyl-D-galactosamine dehydrogenase